MILKVTTHHTNGYLQFIYKHLKKLQTGRESVLSDPSKSRSFTILTHKTAAVLGAKTPLPLPFKCFQPYFDRGLFGQVSHPWFCPTQKVAYSAKKPAGHKQRDRVK